MRSIPRERENPPKVSTKKGRNGNVKIGSVEKKEMTAENFVTANAPKTTKGNGLYHVMYRCLV